MVFLLKELNIEARSRLKNQIFDLLSIKISVFSLFLDVFNGVLSVANTHTRVEFV